MEFDYCWKTHLPTLIGSIIVRDLPMDSVHLQAFGGLTLSRLLGKINTGRVTVNHPVIGLLVCGNDYANGMDRGSISKYESNRVYPHYIAYWDHWTDTLTLDLGRETGRWLGMASG